IQAYIKSWNIQLSPNPVELTGRMLPPEEIVCGNSQVTRLDDKADWTNAFRSQKMMVVQRLARWAIVVTSRDSQGVQNLVGVMQRVSTPLGYMIAPPNPTWSAMDQTSGQLDMIFIILANNNAETYGMVKKRCSIDFGIPSQCFLAKNMNNAKGLMSICTKMVIQMNAKQGGEPWGIKTPLKNIMVLGYDVHHAGPGGGGMSIGAMTATFNETLGRCYSTVATAAGAMFEKCLNAYFNKNNKLPERIMMYRDGVGEGQLNAVFNQELEGFQNRIKATYQHQGVKPPKLTYIVVNKRISTRFFEVAGRNLNNRDLDLLLMT
ncbi:Protein aubergine, partial [Orchesella cincta]